MLIAVDGSVYKLLAVYMTKCNGQGDRLYIREGTRRGGGGTCVSCDVKSAGNI
jgi:hypothetical protein